VLLSIDLPVRTPPCGRPLINPARVTLRALAGHGVFAAMAAAAGPFGPAIWHRRARCADEFWFAAQEGAVFFRVERAATGGALVVQAALTEAGQLPASGRLRLSGLPSPLAAQSAGRLGPAGRAGHVTGGC
jgi:hypothetical protein